MIELSHHISYYNQQQLQFFEFLVQHQSFFKLSCHEFLQHTSIW